MSEQTCTILMVCTGNICRSPMAQVLFAHRLRERLPADQALRFAVASAGTHGLTGWPIERDATRYLASVGVPLDPFEAREIDADLVAGADLVLGATRQHRAAAVTLVPTASSRAFTLLEFARLVRATETVGENDPVERLGQLVSAAARHRATARSAVRGGEDDIADPYGSSYAAFERAGREIDAAVAAIVDRITE